MSRITVLERIRKSLDAFYASPAIEQSLLNRGDIELLLKLAESVTDHGSEWGTEGYCVDCEGYRKHYDWCSIAELLKEVEE